MTAHDMRLNTPRTASGTHFAAIRNQPGSSQPGNLAILASTSTGEVADPTRKPAGFRAAGITLLRTRSALDA